VPLNRDVIFMATADEEAGGALGAGWIVKNHPEAFVAGFVPKAGAAASMRDASSSASRSRRRSRCG
jgi:acetylornithine deacetylase/succinyl-diaminopimelate desuccinylase-like protein